MTTSPVLEGAGTRRFCQQAFGPSLFFHFPKQKKRVA